MVYSNNQVLRYLKSQKKLNFSIKSGFLSVKSLFSKQNTRLVTSITEGYYEVLDLNILELFKPINFCLTVLNF